MNLLNQNEKKQVRAVQISTNRRVCLTNGAVDRCEESLLSATELANFRRHLSPVIGGDLRSDAPPMTTDARKQLLSQLHLTSKYFEHLLTAAKSAPITDGELTVAQDSDPISTSSD